MFDRNLKTFFELHKVNSYIHKWKVHYLKKTNIISKEKKNSTRE